MCIYYYVYLFLCLVVGQGPLFSQNSNPQWNEQWKKEDAQLLHTIQSELKPLLDQHISQNQFDDEYVKKAALRFLNLLDPEKRYLLSVEIEPFFSSSDIFSEGVKKKSLQSFWDLFLIKAFSVHRAQMMRNVLIPFLNSRKKDFSSFHPQKKAAKAFAVDEDELLFYQTDLILSCLSKSSNISVKNWTEQLIRANQELLKEEQEWKAVREDFQKAFSLFHSTILKAFTRALDSHSELLDPKEAEELKEALTNRDGKFKWDIVDMSSGAILVLSLDCFYRGKGFSSELDIRNAWREANQKKPIRGVLLDLSRNRGGFLLEAVKTAGLFIKSGIIVVVEYSDESRRYFRDLDPNVLIDCPVVVLVTKNTASAAEIVTQALSDYGVGIVVGDEHTYGKGSVQMQTVSSLECAHEESSTPYKVTIGEFYGVSGETPQGKGVPSDIVVPSYYSLYPIGEKFMDNGLPDPKKHEPFFQDVLTDISRASLAWYRKYYLPFIQEPQKDWDNRLPLLSQQSIDRRLKDSFWRAYATGDCKIMKRFVPKGESLESFFEKEQKKEALNILQDMIQSSQEK